MRKRIATKTKTLNNGIKVVTRKVVDAPDLEWVLQAAAVRALRAMPEFGAEWAPRADGSWPQFTLAGDFNAGRRSMRESVKAKATGLTPGEADVRVYIAGSRLCMIEYKAAKGRLSADQVTRHALLRGLGFEIEVVRASSEEEAAAATVALVRRWLGMEGAV